MRESVGADDAPGMQLSPQSRPRLQRFAHLPAGGGNVEQDRFDAFHLREAREALRVHLG
jgi:hypothetical protein